MSEPDLEALQPLPFAAKRGRVLRRALTTLGYSSRENGSATVSAENLGRTVESMIDESSPNEILLVHVLSHGHLAESGALYVVGPDGRTHALTDVEQWLKKVENFHGRPYTLFLLDLCHGGVAARLPWQMALANGSSRAWVIAACQPDRSAFDGRFTQAAANVVEALRRGQLDIDRSVRYVPLETVAREIRREVDRLAEANAGLRQQVTCSVVDISADVDLPFFPNPSYIKDERYEVRGRVDTALAPFMDDLDEALDASHFVSRATGHGPMADRIGSGCFSGRENELIALTAWMNGDDDGAIRVVTGSAGVGKSALIGILVCASHPALRRPTRILWEGVASVPARIPNVAAVHARQRGLAEIIDSLARQLGLPGSLSPEELLEKLRQSPTVPVLVIDALDECLDAVALMDRLMLPLATTRDEDGAPLCRLLVGVRSERDFRVLREIAAAEAGLIDLDAVDDDRLRRDLEAYVDKLLRSQSPYDQRPHAPARAAFAAAVAEALVSAREGRRWGEFLVAALYTHHLLTTYQPILDPGDAEWLGLQVPHELPDVLELDLRHREDLPLLRPVLSVLAQALGEGMPSSLVRAVAPMFASEQQLSAGDVAEALEAGRFYLRHRADADGTTIYRLFHQGLTDYLRQHPVDPNAQAEPMATAQEILSHLLSNLSISGENGNKAPRQWSLAEPYLIRHGLQHAVAANRSLSVASDSEFLVHAEHSVIGPFFAMTSVPELLPLAAVYRSAMEASDSPNPNDRRRALSLAAARNLMPDLARQLANPPGQPPLAWQPIWATGGRHAASKVIKPSTGRGTAENLGACSVQENSGGGRFHVRTAAVLRHQNRPAVIAVGMDETIASWDLSTGKALNSWPRIPMITQLREMHIGGQGVVLTIAGNRQWICLDPVAGADFIDASNLISVTEGLEINAAHLNDTYRLRDERVAGAQGFSRSMGESVNTKGIDDEIQPEDWQGQYPRPRGNDDAHNIQGGDRLSTYPVGALASDEAFDAREAAPTAQKLRAGPSASPGLGDPASPQILSVLDGRLVIIRQDKIGLLTVNDLVTGMCLGPAFKAPPSPVTALASSLIDGRLALLSGDEAGSLCLWDLRSRELCDVLTLPERVDMIIPFRENGLVIITGGEIITLQRAADYT